MLYIAARYYSIVDATDARGVHIRATAQSGHCNIVAASNRQYETSASVRIFVWRPFEMLLDTEIRVSIHHKLNNLVDKPLRILGTSYNFSLGETKPGSSVDMPCPISDWAN